MYISNITDEYMDTLTTNISDDHNDTLTTNITDNYNNILSSNSSISEKIRHNYFNTFINNTMWHIIVMFKEFDGVHIN